MRILSCFFLFFCFQNRDTQLPNSTGRAEKEVFRVFLLGHTWRILQRKTCVCLINNIAVQSSSVTLVNLKSCCMKEVATSS